MTFMQAFKVWWSYSWRASILLIPLGIIMTVWSLIELFSAVAGMSLTDQDLSNLNISSLSVDKLIHLMSGGMTLWLVSLVLTAAIQIFAMRWALNSRWSDFRLKAVPPDPEVGSQPGGSQPRPGLGDSSRPASV